MSGEGVIANEAFRDDQGLPSGAPSRGPRVALTDAEIEQLRQVVKTAIEQAGSPLIGKTFAGPRHNELGFETRDGGLIVFSMRDYL